jgi:YesN/AraC family two-component response regulator
MRKGMEMGADDYLTKPFQEVELLKAIESRLKKFEGYTSLQNDSHSEVALAHEALEFLDFVHYPKEKRSSTITKKQVVYSEGDNPARLYFLQKGKIKTYHTNRDGKYFITAPAITPPATAYNTFEAISPTAPIPDIFLRL